MPPTSPDELFRQAAEAEGGQPISAGASVAHMRTALESGRALYLDLSGVPGDQRAALVAQIQELVTRAGGRSSN